MHPDAGIIDRTVEVLQTARTLVHAGEMHVNDIYAVLVEHPKLKKLKKSTLRSMLNQEENRLKPRLKRSGGHGQPFYRLRS